MKPRVSDNLRQLESFLAAVQVVPFDTDAARIFGRIQSELKKRGRPTGVVDAMIAATVISQSGILVTHNLRDFESIQGLSLQDWLVQSQ